MTQARFYTIMAWVTFTVASVVALLGRLAGKTPSHAQEAKSYALACFFLLVAIRAERKDGRA